MGNFPDYIAVLRINGEAVVFGTHLIGRHIIRNDVRVESPAWYEVVCQQVPVGVVGTGIVNPRLEQAGVLLSGVQKLNRIVVPRQRVNDQQRADGERDIHRAGDVQHALVAVRVLHPDFKNAGPAVRVVTAVPVDLNVIGQQLDGFPFEAIDGLVHLVSPVQIQPRAIGRSAGFGVCGDQDFVGQSLHVRVGNLARSVVRRLR